MGEWEDVGKMLTMLAGDWNKGGREAKGKRQEARGKKNKKHRKAHHWHHCINLISMYQYASIRIK